MSASEQPQGPVGERKFTVKAMSGFVVSDRCRDFVIEGSDEMMGPFDGNARVEATALYVDLNSLELGEFAVATATGPRVSCVFCMRTLAKVRAPVVHWPTIYVVDGDLRWGLKDFPMEVQMPRPSLGFYVGAVTPLGDNARRPTTPLQEVAIAG